MERFSELIGALLPAVDAPATAYPGAFRRVAELLLRRVTWFIASTPHRLTEVEFYWNGRAHADPFTHGDPRQRELARWYHHRTGNEYRGGTYKGLDIAIGAPDVAAGILVRGIERLDGDRRLLDGPCVCVDHLLALTKAASVKALAESFDGSVDPPAAGASPSYLVVSEHDHPVPGVYESPRVGLTLKRGASDDRVRFVALPYRFLSEPARIKKGRLHLVVSLHRQGMSVGDIAGLTGSSTAQVAKYAAQYDAGRGRDPASFARELTSDALCQLFGACEAQVEGMTGDSKKALYLGSLKRP
jgi:3-methyladenine DNA glycosylase Mpg